VTDGNKYQEMIESGALLGFKISFYIICTFTIFWAAKKLYGFIKVYGIQQSPAQICLLLEILGAAGKLKYSS
jgi:hypothetical protein